MSQAAHLVRAIFTRLFRDTHVHTCTHTHSTSQVMFQWQFQNPFLNRKGHMRNSILKRLLNTGLVMSIQDAGKCLLYLHLEGAPLPLSLPHLLFACSTSLDL